MDTHALTIIPASGVRGVIARTIDVLGRFPLPLAQLLFRLAVASVFLKAGLNKLASWEFTVQLFADEYRVDGLRYDQVSVIDHDGAPHGWSFCQDLTSTLHHHRPGALNKADQAAIDAILKP